MQVDTGITNDTGDGTDLTGLPVTQAPQAPQASPEAEEPVLGDDPSIRQLLEQAANLTVDDDGRLRDEKGKFAKEPDKPDTQEPAATGEPQQQAQPTQVQLPDELNSVIQALPEANRSAVQTAIATREAAWNTFAQQVKGHVDGYEALRPLLEPRRQAWALQGVSEGQALNQLLALSDFATRDPSGFIQWFAGNNGIDLSDVGETFVPPDPVLQNLQTQVTNLTNALNGMTTGAANQQHQQIVDAVKAFEVETDANGQALRPHFAAVANIMLPLVPGIRQANPGMSHNQVLQAAYDQAIYADPTTRATVLATEKAAKDAAAAAEIARKKSAGQSMTGVAPMNGTVQAHEAPSDTVRGALEWAIAQHS